MDKNLVYLENFGLKIFTRLHKRGFVFLIKTEDHVFDAFLLNKITNGSLNSKHNKSLDFIHENIDSTSIKDITYDFVNVRSVDDEIISTLTQLIETTTANPSRYSVYYLPKLIIYRFFEQKSVDEFLSSCVFISEEIPNLGPLVVEKSLEILFAETLSTHLSKHFLEIVENRNMSLSKVMFYAFSYKSELFGVDELTLKTHAKAFPIENFLDEKGNEFITLFFEKIALETIEAFFRSFIFIEKESITPTSLRFEQISSITQAPEDQIRQLLELAKSPQFEILTEEEGIYGFKIPEYITEWHDLKRWIKKEESTFKQYKQLEALAQDYFQSAGTLLSKEQVEQALNWREETLPDYNWEEKYKLDKDLISSYILLSQNNLEEALKKQQKKRSRLLKNSVRISIAVSIAFLLSSFTALLAYLERNSAIKQQELAILAKEDADEARLVAETERLQAIEARQNESLALEEAKYERMLALDSKGQAEMQRKNALSALDMAEKSALEASVAKEIAEKNEQLANEAREVAQLNFKTSERLRNQQEARATSLEALGHFANEDFNRGTLLAQTAFEKNITNGGFPLQSDIFSALLFAKLTSEESKLVVDLEHPAKFITLSTSKNKLAVYTINGEIRIYATQPEFVLSEVIQTGYIQSMEFISETQLLFTSLEGNLLSLDIQNSKPNFYIEQLASNKYKALFKIPGHENIWIATNQSGGTDLLNYQKTNSFFKIKEQNGEKIQAMDIKSDQIAWAEGNKFYHSSLFDEDRELLFTASSEITSITWSQIHASWIVGLTSGQLLAVHPDRKQDMVESFAIHASKISQLKLIPYVYNTELLFSTGFDGSIYIYVLDQNLPFSASISSKISFPKHRSWITGFAIDPERKIAYSISNDRSLKIWPLSIEELLQRN